MTAKAIETGTAKTEGLGPKDESAVAQPFAQTQGETTMPNLSRVTDMPSTPIKDTSNVTG